MKELAQGDVLITDGGIHGVQGHTIHLRADGTARWQRTTDGFMPVGPVGAGPLELSAAERAQLAAWCDLAWQLAPEQAERLAKWSGQPVVPRWTWAITQRRGDEVRTLQQNLADLEPPAAARPLFEWLRTKVDNVAARAPLAELRLYVATEAGILGVDEGGVVVHDGECELLATSEELGDAWGLAAPRHAERDELVVRERSPTQMGAGAAIVLRRGDEVRVLEGARADSVVRVMRASRADGPP